MKFLVTLFLVISVVAVSSKTAQPHAYPWVVDLRHYVGSSHNHWCGGVIVSPEWILTEASCTAKTEVIVAGDHNVKVEEGTEQARGVKLTVRHPSYKFPGNTGYRVALIKVDSPFAFNEYVAALPMQSASTKILESGVVSVGWSPASNDGYYQDVLQYSERELQTSNGICTAEGEEQRLCITQGDRECAGDNGSPVVCTDFEGNSLLCGITITNVCGGDQDVPAAARIDMFYDWIQEAIAEN